MKLRKCYSDAKAQRKVYDTIWRTAYKYTQPLRWHDQESGDGIQKQLDQKAAIFDSTSNDAVRLIASSIISSLTPSSASWFTFSLPDDEFSYQAKKWIDDAVRITVDEINQSNYQSVALDYFYDIAISGNGILYIDVDKETNNLNFEVWPFADCFFQASRGKEIDTIHRTFTLKASQALELYGKLPRHFTDLLKDGKDSNLNLCHTIKPRDKKQKSKSKFSKLAPLMAFESTIWITDQVDDNEAVLKTSGYSRFPCVIARWAQLPNSDYGIGLVDSALPDIKSLNKYCELLLTNADMIVSPPLIAAHDGVLNPNTIRLGPRRIIMANSTDNLKPLNTNSNVSFVLEEIQRLQSSVRKLLLADQLAPLEKANATATEVLTRNQIVRKLLGPVFGRLEAEFLAPLLTRVFELVASIAGKFPELPPELATMVVTPEFQNPTAQATRMEEVQNIQNFEQMLLGMAQVDQKVLMHYDFEAAARYKADKLGIPEKLMRDQYKVKQMQQVQAQMAQQQQAQALGPVEEENI